MWYDRPNRPQWTEAKRSRLRALRKEGKTFAECARLMNTTRSAIAGQCDRYMIEGPQKPTSQQVDQAPAYVPSLPPIVVRKD